MIEIVPTSGMTPDTRYVADHMRIDDVEELWQLARVRPYEAVEQAMNVSTEAYVARHKGVPIAVFGAVVPVLGGYGVPWLLGTRGVDAVPNEYMRLIRKFTAHLLERCERLENVALASNRKTLVFLSRAGFVIGEPFTTASGARAVRFEMRGKDDV